MNETKTEHGKIWQTSTGFVHVTFFNNFENKSITIVGGGVHKYNELLLDLETGEYVNEEIEWVEHGIWKLKYKLK